MCHAVGASSGKWGRTAPGLVLCNYDDSILLADDDDGDNIHIYMYMYM